MNAPTLSRRRMAALILAAPWAAAACGPAPTGPEQPVYPVGSLEWAAAGPWRIEPERDLWRHPIVTLRFWGIAPAMTVLEILPGRGWYTAILAPYLARGGGKLIAASFDLATASPAKRETLADFEARFMHEPQTFGTIERTVVSESASLAEPGSVDLAILANNVHTLMAEGIAERVFAAVFQALKPGGAFGIEQHRASSSGLQDPLAGTGYVQEAYVRTLAQEAGFEFVAASDVNANPRDTRNHPFGVWSLPPVLRTSPLGQPDDPYFDTTPFTQIGESDRMTLKFRRPGGSATPVIVRERAG
jgi:predicted methyltransferase